MTSTGNKNYDYLIKILILGDSGTGKSAILLRYMDDEFNTSYITTIGIDFKVRTVTIKGKRVRVQVWDTAGQERFRTITQAYYIGCHGILIVYDCTDRDSFEHVQQWIRDLNNRTDDVGVNRMIIGNKVDLINQKVIDKTEGEKMSAEYNMKYFETSAKTGEKIEEVFTTILTDILDRLENNVPQSEKGTVKVSDSSKDSMFKMDGKCCKN